jgi:hypothetical protein
VRIKCSEVWWNNNVIWWGVMWVYSEQCRKLLLADPNTLV